MNGWRTGRARKPAVLPTRKIYEYMVLVCNWSGDSVRLASGLYEARRERNQRRAGWVCSGGDSGADNCRVPRGAVRDGKLESEGERRGCVVFRRDRRVRGSGDDPFLSAVSKGRTFVSRADGARGRRGDYGGRR